MAIELVEMEENDTVPGVVKMWCVFFLKPFDFWILI